MWVDAILLLILVVVIGVRIYDVLAHFICSMYHVDIHTREMLLSVLPVVIVLLMSCLCLGAILLISR